MDITNITAGSREFTSNAYLVTDGAGRNAMVDAGSGDDVVDRIGRETASLDALVLTHTHPDHVGAVGDIVERFGVEVWGYGEDNRYVDRVVADGDTVSLGGVDFEAIHTPGHAVDHLCLYGDGVLFSGDLVFGGGSFGRTDIAGADRETLIASIEELLDRIGDRPIDAMYAGHQPPVHDDARKHVESSLRNAKQMR